jgi:adenosylhomocysteinase
VATSLIKDPSLAGQGNKKIDWVAQHSPVLTALRTTYLNDGTLDGLRVGMTIPFEAKTAYLAWILAEAGASVAIAPPIPAYCQDDVAAGLASRGVTVFASSDVPEDRFQENLERVLETDPHIIIDDRGELTVLLHSRRVDLGQHVRGASEETTSGVTRLRAMERQGVLRFPVIAANNARCKHLFDNRYGTGQSCLTAIMDTTNLFMAGKRIVVVGYGWCGKGIARRAKGLGARVTVVEADPVRGLEAYADGFEVHPLEDCASGGDIFITSTGVRGAISRAHILEMKDGAILANAGGIDVEIEEPALRAIATEVHDVRPHITEYVLPAGQRIDLLADGKVVNLAAADGHPVEIMDLTFSVQALGLWYLANHAVDLTPRVYPFPDELDREIARLKLESLGMGVTTLTPEQKAFLESWD